MSVEVLLDLLYTLHRIAFFSCLKLNKISRVATPGGPGQACLIRSLVPSPLIQKVSRTRIVDGHRDQSQSTRNQPSPPFQREVDYGDSSRSLYAMYCKIAEEEDKRLEDVRLKDADGILIFVSSHVSPHYDSSIDSACQPES